MNQSALVALERHHYLRSLVPASATAVRVRLPRAERPALRAGCLCGEP